MKKPKSKPVALSAPLVLIILGIILFVSVVTIAGTGLGTTAVSSILTARNQPTQPAQQINQNLNQPITIINELPPTAVPPTQPPTAVPPTPAPTATPQPTATPMQEIEQLLYLVQQIASVTPIPTATPAPTATPITAQLIHLQTQINQLNAIQSEKPSLALPIALMIVGIVTLVVGGFVMFHAIRISKPQLENPIIAITPPPTAVPAHPPTQLPTTQTAYPTLPDNYLILRRRDRTDDIEKLVSLIRRHSNDERLYYNGRITKRRIAKILSPYLFDDGEQREYAGSFTTIVDEAYLVYTDSLRGATTATTTE